ncbi:MAG: hypothetical protein IJK27_05670 [Bacilli bacterium]|nr:hypothetical protein [Bacilli bacterium]
MKKILFVNGSYNEIPLIDAAHKLGMFAITSGNDPHGDGHPFADQYIPGDYSKCDVILNIAKENKVSYICSCGNDFGAISASYACEKLNLPGHDTFKVCKYFHEKDQFKKLCSKLNLCTPKSYSFNSIEEAIKHLESVEFPQIVKPSDLGGGKGIQVVNSYEEGVEAIKIAYKMSNIKTILIEDYILGEQHGYTCFIKDEKVEFVYYTDDFSYLNPYMVWVAIPHEKGKDEALIKKISADVELMAKHLHMADGYLTIQIIVKNGVPYYIETMRRCLGNLHYKCISWDLGINAYELFVANECGLDLNKYLKKEYPLFSYSAFMGIYADKNGSFTGYSIDEKYKKYVRNEMLIEKVGYEITDYLRQKLGMIFFTFSNEKERNEFVNNMTNVVKVHVK